MADECLNDYSHRYSKSFLKEKVDILKEIKNENITKPMIL